MSAYLSGVIDRLRSGTCWFTASNAEPLHYDHHRSGRGSRTRTCNHRDQNPMLCQLSYAPSLLAEYLVPPRRIERHPPALQAGAQTTYAREAMIVGTPRENRTPTKRFGNSCAATTPAGHYFVVGAPGVEPGMFATRDRGYSPVVHTP